MFTNNSNPFYVKWNRIIILLLGTSLDHFTEQREKMISGYGDMIYTGLSIDECASECLGEQSWSCNSFQFCFGTGYCVLYKLHPDEHPNAVKNALLCDLFTSECTFVLQALNFCTSQVSIDTTA